MIAMKLHLGCGDDVREGYVNVDLPAVIAGAPRTRAERTELVGVDLDAGTWPWPDSTFAHILGRDVFDHVADPIHFMNEVVRLLTDGGVATLLVPHYREERAFTDPTRRRHSSEHTFDYWIRGTELFEKHPSYRRGGPGFGSAKVRLLDDGTLSATLIR